MNSVAEQRPEAKMSAAPRPILDPVIDELARDLKLSGVLAPVAPLAEWHERDEQND